MANRFGSSVNDRPSVGSSKTPYANLNDGESSAPLQAGSNVSGSNPGAPPKKSEHDVELTKSSAALFETSPIDHNGLTEEEVQDRRRQFGWNELPEKKVNKWVDAMFPRYNGQAAYLQRLRARVRVREKDKA